MCYVQVKSTWDENLYTTKLDKSKIGISEQEAEQIAREIERQATRNRHIAEERGVQDLSLQEVWAMSRSLQVAVGRAFKSYKAALVSQDTYLYKVFPTVGVEDHPLRLPGLGCSRPRASLGNDCADNYLHRFFPLGTLHTKLQLLCCNSYSLPLVQVDKEELYFANRTNAKTEQFHAATQPLSDR